MKIRLGEVTMDTAARQLVRGSATVHLSPKAFDLLTILVEHRPRALGKPELHQRLWPDTFVSDGNLASLVAEVRGALGDAARKPAFIRTAHRFGYAFCGEAEDVTAGTLAAPAIFCWLVNGRRRIPLPSGETVIGREPGQGVQVQSPTVSRRHARISIAGTQATLEDLGSKNGTFLGPAPVRDAVRLKDGDEIRTGSVVFRFRMAAPGAATETWSGSEG